MMFKKSAIGLFAGLISGMFGAGGGLVLLSIFVHILKLEEKEARATTIASILPMATVTGIFYSSNNLIEWNLAIKCAIGGIIGAIIGTRLLKLLSNTVLRGLFVVFLVYISFKFIMG
ncbi:MAG: sulfite exporter TauE/SafE family protein [Oscillospiraceae bacterium]|nr:sulfite exporter TauE/SafE family protein [Oscillospiraceae bacterium]